jgi:hypothetical protein
MNSTGPSIFITGYSDIIKIVKLYVVNNLGPKYFANLVHFSRDRYNRVCLCVVTFYLILRSSVSNLIQINNLNFVLHFAEIRQEVRRGHQVLPKRSQVGSRQHPNPQRLVAPANPDARSGRLQGNFLFRLPQMAL